MSVSSARSFLLSAVLFSGLLLSCGCERQVRAMTPVAPVPAPTPAPTTTTDLSGKWSYSGNGLHATLTLTQTVTSVSGTLVVTTVGHPDNGGTGIVDGTLTSSNIVIDLEFPSVSHFADGKFSNTYMSGTAEDNAGSGKFSWKASKQ
ncbi:MAG: hypothetical protein HQ559_03340 [Lentisphaerae bacterium]|nr:hypothetical protein [Lentisphaerota bacterium]